MELVWIEHQDTDGTVEVKFRMSRREIADLSSVAISHFSKALESPGLNISTRLYWLYRAIEAYDNDTERKNR